MSCPVVIHPDRISPRPKSVASRSRRSRPADDRESPHPEWRTGFEQQTRNLEHHINRSKTEAANSSWQLSNLREETTLSEQRSVRSFISDGESIAESVANVMKKEFNIMRDWIMEKNADQKIWLESEFSEIKAEQLRVLEGLQNLHATQNTNQETHLTPILKANASSKLAPVAPQYIGNVQPLGASEEDQEAGSAAFHSKLPSLPDIDSSSSAVDGEKLPKDKTQAFNRISVMVTSDVQSKKGNGSDLQHALGLTPEDIKRIREAHVGKYSVGNLSTSTISETKSSIPDKPPPGCLSSFVRGGLFTGIVSLVVILNSIFIGIDVNEDMHRAVHNEGEQDSFFETMNVCCTIFFTIELILRVVGLRLWFIFGDDVGWNLFDTVLVAISGIDLVIGEMSSNLFFMRILKIFRLIRILRIMRLLQFFRELRRIVMSILASVQVFIWALSLILLMMFCLSAVIMRAGADYLAESGTSADRILWKQFYGSIPISMYMLLQCVSGGQDWGLMVEPLEMISWVYKILYVVFILFIIFGLLNVLTGVFIGTAAEVMDRDFITQAEIFKQRRFVADMKRLVHELAGDKTDEITWPQFCKLTEKPQTQAFLAAHGLSASDGPLLFGLCAGSMDATELCIQDFATGCHRLKGPANQLQVEALMIELELVHSFISVSFTKVLKYLRAAENANRRILTRIAPPQTDI